MNRVWGHLFDFGFQDSKIGRIYLPLFLVGLALLPFGVPSSLWSRESSVRPSLSERFTSVTSELRVEEKTSLVIVNTTFRFITTGEKIIHGFSLPLPAFSEDEEGNHRPLTYHFQQIERTTVNSNTPPLTLPVSTRAEGGYMYLILGDIHEPLPAGTYDYQIDCSVAGLLIDTPNETILRWHALPEMPVMVEKVETRVVPPGEFDIPGVVGRSYFAGRNASAKDLISIPQEATLSDKYRDQLGQWTPWVVFTNSDLFNKTWIIEVRWPRIIRSGS